LERQPKPARREEIKERDMPTIDAASPQETAKKDNKVIPE
jgi:hypothetical protein